MWTLSNELSSGTSDVATKWRENSVRVLVTKIDYVFSKFIDLGSLEKEILKHNITMAETDEKNFEVPDPREMNNLQVR